MSLEFDIRPSVQKDSELPFERLRVVQRLSELRLADVRAGIVFVFAKWSAPAVMAWRRFTHVLSTLDLGSLDIIVLDIDCMTPDDTIRLFGHVFGGAGETLWVRDGRVVAELSAFGPEAEVLVASFTQEILLLTDRDKPTHTPYPENPDGPFYSESDGCVTCGAPHVAAPELMSWCIDPSGTHATSHCFFKRQPATSEEVQHAINAMHSSCVENLRYSGRDPEILETLCRMGYRHLCDSLESSE